MRKMKFLAFARKSEITRREWRERKRRRSFAFFYLLVGDDTQLMAARCAVSPEHYHSKTLDDGAFVECPVREHIFPKALRVPARSIGIVVAPSMGRDSK